MTATKAKPPVVGISDTVLEYWQERDRLHVALGLRSEFRDDSYIAGWWDEDAAEMFDQGFFSTKGHILGRLIDKSHLHASVYNYCRDMGLLPPRPYVTCLACNGKLVPRKANGRIKPEEYDSFVCVECLADERADSTTEPTSDWRNARRRAGRFTPMEDT